MQLGDHYDRIYGAVISSDGNCAVSGRVFYNTVLHGAKGIESGRVQYLPIVNILSVRWRYHRTENVFLGTGEGLDVETMSE